VRYRDKVRRLVIVETWMQFISEHEKAHKERERNDGHRKDSRVSHINMSGEEFEREITDIKE